MDGTTIKLRASPAATSDSAGRPQTGLVASIIRLIAWIRKEGKIRHDIDHLVALDDRLLSDISLSRGNVEHVLRYAGFRKPAND